MNRPDKHEEGWHQDHPTSYDESDQSDRAQVLIEVARLVSQVGESLIHRLSLCEFEIEVVSRI